MDATSQPDSTFSDRTAVSDLIVAVLVVACGGLLFVTTDSVEHLLPMLVRWEKAQADDLLLSLWLAVAVAGWFAWRRWRQSTRQVQALRRSARERARYLSRLEELSTQLLEVEQHERHRLAELLHDEVGQTLYACQLKLHLLTPYVSVQGAGVLAQASELAVGAMSSARDLARQLSPPELDDLSLEDAILSVLPRLEQRYALSIRCVTSPAWQQVPRRLYGPLFHSIEELVLNAAKHAGAASISLLAEAAGAEQLRITVADDGQGFDLAQTPRGFGLFSVERRMACMHGRLELQSEPAAGTRASLCFPVGA